MSSLKCEEQLLSVALSTLTFTISFTSLMFEKFCLVVAVHFQQQHRTKYIIIIKTEYTICNTLHTHIVIKFVLEFVNGVNRSVILRNNC